MSGTRFVVSRFNWSRGRGEGEYKRSAGGRPVASFPTWAEAVADRDRRELAVRATVNPFRCGPAVHYWTSLDEPRLRDWLTDHDIAPPAGSGWADWWDGVRATLSPAQTAAAWEALDKVRFHAVEGRPAGPVVYAVVAVQWEYNDEWHYAVPGEPVVAFRTRERAEAEVARRTAAALDDWTGGDPEAAENIACDPSLLDELAAGPFGPPAGHGEDLKPLAEVPLFEVVELDWEDG